jgi:hypothetical protein
MYDPFDDLKPSSQRKTNEPHPLFDGEGFPGVSRLIFGVGNASGDSYEHKPRNMTLFHEGDVLKVVFGCGDNDAKLYTTVSELGNLLEQVEQQLKKKAYSWREPKPEKDRTWRKG